MAIKAGRLHVFHATSSYRPLHLPAPVDLIVRSFIRAMLHLHVSLLFLTLAHMSLGLTCSHAQTSTVTPGWEKVGVCHIRFLIPRGLKNQRAKGIDSCVAEFRNGKMRLAIDAGGFGGGEFIKAETMLDFVEESVVVDGKKVHIITYRDGRAKAKHKFVARLFVMLHEGKSRDTYPSAFLYMTVEGKSENELELARQIFRSIQFDIYRPFLIEW